MTVRHRSGGRSDRSADSTREVGDVLRENVGELKEQAGETAAALTQALRARSQTLIDAQKTRAAVELTNLSAAMRRAADKLHVEKSESLARYADAAAERLEDVARYVDQNDLSDLAREAQEFARRRPALIAGGVFLAGLAFARFVKAAQPPESSSNASRRNGSRGRTNKSSRRPR